MISDYDCLSNICQRRKSVRRFKETKISKTNLEKIKRIALTSPYTSRSQHWELIVITDTKQIEDISSVVEDKIDVLRSKTRDDFNEYFTQYSKNFTFFKNSPSLFIPVFRIQPVLSTLMEKSEEDINIWERDNYVKSIACVSMLILLAAESLGLGGCFMTGPLIAEDEIKNILNIKLHKRIGAIIPVGYSKGE